MLQSSSGLVDAERASLAPANFAARRTSRRPSALHLCVLLVLGAGAWAGARLLLLSHEATAHLRGSEAFSPVVVRKLGGDLKQQTQRQQQQGPSSVNVLSPLLPPSSNDPWVGATPAAAVPAAHASSARAGEVAVSAGAALTAAAHVASTARPAADASVLARVDGGGHGTPEAAPSDAAMSMPPIISDRTSRVHSEQQGGLTTNITTTIARGNPVVPPNPAAPAGTSPGALSTSAAPGGAEPGPAGALPPLLIPRILHHNYLSGVQELQRVAASPKTHFRKEWWLSCQTHHPGWEVRFWDRAAAVELLESRYPWFLPTWLNYSSLVLQSDALRPFILHAHGGVYLDLDTECFRSMEDSLRGHSLVLMAEEPGLLNNAQMASVPHLPLWVAGVAGRMAAKAAEGVTDPLWATGPRVVTAAFRELVGREDGDLPGLYRLPSNGSSRNATHSSGREVASGAEAGEGGTSQPYGGTAMVYGPRQWFSPCAWNDERCHVAVSRATPLLRRGPQGLRRALSRWTAAARLQLAYANGDAKASVQDRSSILVRQAVDGAVHGGAAAGGGGGDGGSVGGDGDRVDEGEVQKVEGEHGQEEEREVRLVGSLDVVGMHHFSGSWLGYDGSKAERAKDAVTDGLVRFMTDPGLFVEVDAPSCCGLIHTASEGRGMEAAIAATPRAAMAVDSRASGLASRADGGDRGGGDGEGKRTRIGAPPGVDKRLGEGERSGNDDGPEGAVPHLCPSVWGAVAHTAGAQRRQQQGSSPAEQSPSHQASTRRCKAMVVVPSAPCRMPDAAVRTDGGTRTSHGGWRPLVDPAVLRHAYGCAVQVLEVDSCRAGEVMRGRARGHQGAAPGSSSPATGRGTAVDKQEPQQQPVTGVSTQLPVGEGQQGAGPTGGRAAAATGAKTQASALEETTTELQRLHGHGREAAALRVDGGHGEGKGVGSVPYDSVDFDHDGGAVDLLVLDCGDCGWRLASYLHRYGTTGYFQEHVSGGEHVGSRGNGTTFATGTGGHRSKKLLLTSDGVAVDLGRMMRGVRTLLLVGLPPLPYSRRSQLYDLYVQLYQVYGFVGYYHGGYGLESGSGRRCDRIDSSGGAGKGARGMDWAEAVIGASSNANTRAAGRGDRQAAGGRNGSKRHDLMRLLDEPAAVGEAQQRWAVGGCLTLGFVQSRALPQQCLAFDA